jgi:hypothetical protein
MNFSYSKNYFFKNFSSQMYKNKYSFNMLNSKINSRKFFISFSNKNFLSHITALNSCTMMKSAIVPFSLNLNGSSTDAIEILGKEDMVEILHKSGKFLNKFSI